MNDNVDQKLNELLNQKLDKLLSKPSTEEIIDDLKKLVVYDVEIDDKGCSCCSPSVDFDKWREVGDCSWFSTDNVVKANDIVKLLNKYLNRDEN